MKGEFIMEENKAIDTEKEKRPLMIPENPYDLRNINVYPYYPPVSDIAGESKQDRKYHDKKMFLLDKSCRFIKSLVSGYAYCYATTIDEEKLNNYIINYLKKYSISSIDEDETDLNKKYSKLIEFLKPFIISNMKDRSIYSKDSCSFLYMKFDPEDYSVIYRYSPEDKFRELNYAGIDVNIKYYLSKEESEIMINNSYLCMQNHIFSEKDENGEIKLYRTKYNSQYPMIYSIFELENRILKRQPPLFEEISYLSDIIFMNKGICEKFDEAAIFYDTMKDTNFIIMV
jgi:hypothetical protein